MSNFKYTQNSIEYMMKNKDSDDYDKSEQDKEQLDSEPTPVTKKGRKKRLAEENSGGER